MTIKKIRKTIARILLIGFVVLIGTLAWGQLSIHTLPTSKPKDTFRIISMNVSAGNMLSLQAQDELIRSEPDIIAVIEWNGNNLDLRKFDSAGYKAVIDHPRKTVHGICVLSKLPGEVHILESPVLTPCTLPVGQFRFRINQTPFCLFAVHAPPPVQACAETTGDYLGAIASWISEGRLNQDIGIGKPGDKVLITGDLNTLPFQNALVLFKKAGMTDHYSTFNFIAPTWKPYKRWPYLAKIDYILIPKGIACKDQLRFEIDGSDHLGVLGDIGMIGIE